MGSDAPSVIWPFGHMRAVDYLKTGAVCARQRQYERCVKQKHLIFSRSICSICSLADGPISLCSRGRYIFC